MNETDAGASSDRLQPLGGAEDLPGVQLHQVFEAEIGQRRLRGGRSGDGHQQREQQGTSATQHERARG